MYKNLNVARSIVQIGRLEFSTPNFGSCGYVTLPRCRNLLASFPASSHMLRKERFFFFMHVGGEPPRERGYDLLSMLFLPVHCKKKKN